MFLTTLGKFELLDGTHDAPGARLIGPAKPLAMFAYLALTPKRRASRDTLVGLLWSDGTSVLLVKRGWTYACSGSYTVESSWTISPP